MIDSHQHFWKLSRNDYFWLNTMKDSVIYQDYSPEMLAPLLQRYGIAKTILVQAAPTVAETYFLIELSKQYQFIGGIVGWIDMLHIDAIKQLELFQNFSIIKGIRPLLEEIKDINWIMNPKLSPILKALEKSQLSFDALVKLQNLEGIVYLAEHYPDLPIVIDHAAKPYFEDQDFFTQWVAKMKKLVRYPHVYCKISGFLTELSVNQNISLCNRYFAWLVENFSPQRLMWGSDWPVLNLVSHYDQWWQISKTWFSSLDEDSFAAITDQVARDFYRI